MRTCTIDGCDRAHRARGLCTSHYNQAHQPNRHRKFMLKCDWCGTECEKFPSSTIRKRFCSMDCRGMWAKSEQGLVQGMRRPGPKPPTTPKQRRIAQREVTEALARGDYRTAASLIQLLSIVTGECWLWPTLDESGYGRLNGKAAHRLSLEAHLAAPLGRQPVHHKCANRACVKPEHLQPVTHYDNAAEMLARGYMTTRIRLLEQALRELNPSHELLAEVGLPIGVGAKG